MRRMRYVTLGILVLLVTTCIFWLAVEIRRHSVTKQLCNAVRQNDLNTVLKIIEEYPASVNNHPSIMSQEMRILIGLMDTYPLTEACYLGRFEIAKRLIDAGANVNSIDTLTPLSATLLYKHEGWYDMAVFLIHRGANVSTTSVFINIVESKPGNTVDGYFPENSEEVNELFLLALQNCIKTKVDWNRVLCKAITNDRIEIVRLLLSENCCGINEITPNSAPPLWFALTYSDEAMIRLLLEFGADVNMVLENGTTLLEYARLTCDKGILKLVESYAR